METNETTINHIEGNLHLNKLKKGKISLETTHFRKHFNSFITTLWGFRNI